MSDRHLRHLAWRGTLAAFGAVALVICLRFAPPTAPHHAARDAVAQRLADAAPLHTLVVRER